MAAFNGPLTRILKKNFPAEDTPDPWDEETDKAVRGRETITVCTRCLEPGASETSVCRNCGFPSGDYVNTMPYLYIFSIGAFFRPAVDGTTSLTFSKVLGIGIIAIGQYGLFAPIYWVRLFFAWIRQQKDLDDRSRNKTIATPR